MDDDDKSIYKSVYKAMHDFRNDDVKSISKFRDDMVDVRSNFHGIKPVVQTANSEPITKIVTSEFNDIPDEQTIAYSPERYTMGNIRDIQEYRPSQFLRLEKNQNFEGWLLLQSDLEGREFRVKPSKNQKKYCMLIDKVLFVYDEDKLHMRKPLMMLNFDLHWFALDPPDLKNLNIKLVDVNRKNMFSFMAETIPSKDQWIKYLAIHLQASCGVREKIFRLSRYSNFWQKFVITPAQMCHIGGHGDILLFRTNNTMANAQRFFTSSEFGKLITTIDHVAMLVQTEDKKIVVLEALGKVGVELNEWEKFIDRGWYKLYERIAYRKLTCKRDARFNQALSNFINDSVGKKYEITFQKLMKMNSLIAGSTYKDAKEYESFFCSELVAAAYKSCGLVSQSKSCSQYWPSSFGDKESIDFLGGAKLEAQVDLVFDL